MFNKVSFIGAGSMSEAIIAGLINQEVIRHDQIFVTNKSDQDQLLYLENKYKVNCLEDKNQLLENAEVIVLSVKPFDVIEAIKSIKPFIKPNQLIVSVVAGVYTESIEELIGGEIAVVRAMPNTSASIGASATALAKGTYATDKDLVISETLFKAIGTTEIIAEKDMHVVTAISGSGPAYIYYLVEAMEKAAVESGLDLTTAKALISQTIIGAGKMLKQTDKETATLRKEITSPAGTTEAGLKALADNEFQKGVMECVYKARDRSIELGEK